MCFKFGEKTESRNTISFEDIRRIAVLSRLLNWLNFRASISEKRNIYVVLTCCSLHYWVIIIIIIIKLFKEYKTGFIAIFSLIQNSKKFLENFVIRHGGGGGSSQVPNVPDIFTVLRNKKLKKELRERKKVWGGRFYILNKNNSNKKKNY